MNIRKLTRHPLSVVLIAYAVLALLLSACQPGTISTSLPTVQPTATVPPAQPPTATQPPASTSGDISLDLSGLAKDQTVETVPAVPASAGGPIWEVLPQYRRVTLQGYPVTDHLMKAQIFIFPAADLAGFNEGAGRMAADLQALLLSQKTVDFMPFLPPFNAQQVLHAQVQYLDFENGSGVRFLTQFDQAPLPINNFELIYTFQGLTRDGKTYIAAVLPVTHPDLPANNQVSAEQASELNDFPAYLAKTVTWLDQQPGGSFTPDLAKLDALIQSIEVK
jgi:hypothetical protein